MNLVMTTNKGTKSIRNPPMNDNENATVAILEPPLQAMSGRPDTNQIVNKEPKTVSEESPVAIAVTTLPKAIHSKKARKRAAANGATSIFRISNQYVILRDY